MSREALKTDAKYAMREAIVSPYIVTLIFGVITVVFSAVEFFLDTWEELLDNGGFGSPDQMRAFAVSSIIFFIIYFVLSTIIQFGYYSYCLKVANRDHSMSYGDLFSPVKYLLKALGLVFLSTLFILLWALLLIIPGIIAAYRYSQSIFIMVEDPDKGVMQCIRESKEMMEGHKWEYFVLELSFILWQLLIFATCGLALIYVYPYMTVTFANYYNALKHKPSVYDGTTVYY
ncbi:DUF975 family protein [Lachnospiraceae bacterium 54-53]